MSGATPEETEDRAGTTGTGTGPGAVTGALGRFFELDEHDTDVRTELLAGLTTFLTMAYIVVVNPAILSTAIAPAGFSRVQVISMLTVVTILAAVVATTVTALYANRPFAQAPGLGLNAFFAFTVVGALGVPWQTALAAVVVEGVLFVALTAVGAREYLIEAFPTPVKLSVGAGIGAFLALVGLEEMNVVVAAPESTYVTLGPIASDPVAALSLAGLFFTLALYARGVRGSIVLGIVATTLVGAAATVAGLVDPGVLAVEAVRNGGLDLSKLSGATYDIRPLAGAFLAGLSGIEPVTFALVVFTFFFVDFFDTAGTLTGVGHAAGFLDEEGNLPGIDRPLLADAIGTTVGGMLGTSTVTTYVESATGVEEGGRTGLTALTVAALFLVALLFVPLATAVPTYAGHIALVVVAVVMLRNVAEVEWSDLTHAVPAALTILVMPFTFNIGYGIAAGIVSYVVVTAAADSPRKVSPAQYALAASFVAYFVVRTRVLG